jgi:hypothetical protein
VVVVVVVSEPVSQEISVRERIASAEERMIKRGVFIDFGQSKFTMLSRDGCRVNACTGPRK